MTHATWVLAGLAVLLLLGKGLQVVQRRTGVPDALVLLGLGALVAQGSALSVKGLGGLVPVFTTSALVLLLFEGAIDVRVEELRRAARATLLLTCVSFLFSMLAVAAVGFLLLGLEVLPALLLGSIVGGTSSSVVVPLVRQLRLGKELQLVLTLESALNDVLCVVGALVLLALCQGQELDGWALTLGLGRDAGAALVLGVLCGGLLALALGALRGRGSSFMVLLASLFLVYSLAEGLTGQGVLACLAFGMVLGNAPMLLAWAPGGARAGLREADREFVQEGAFLFKVLFFVYLGASFHVEDASALVSGVVAVVALLLVRPWAVRASLSPERTSRRDASVAAVLSPKGLAAAVLATLPAQRGLPEGARIATVVGAVVVVSIVISTVLAALAGRRAGLLPLRALFGAYGGEPAAEPVPSEEKPEAVTPDRVAA